MKDRIEATLGYGVDVVGRRIFLHGDVDEDSIALAIRALYLMADLEDKPIELFVASYGGDIDEAFALHDVTRTVKVPVHTIALGMCMSAAPFLVACGQPGHRYASENCGFMLHTASFEAEGPMLNIAGTAEAIRSRCERMDRLLAKYTTKPFSFWAKFSKSGVDHYFGAEQALEWGLIDHIWAEK